MGLVELEIVARSEPKLIKSLAEFICDLFLNNRMNSTSIFSFQATTHMCSVFNPYGSIIDTLFRIYASTNSMEFSSFRKDSDKSLKLISQIGSSIDSLTDMTGFSETLKIKREIGPLLLTYCLLVISKDNQLHEINDYIYFIRMYAIILSTNEHPEVNRMSISNQVRISEDRFNTIVNLITWNKGIKSKQNIMPVFWMKRITPKLLHVRDGLCISISILDVDLFEEDKNDGVIKESLLVKVNRNMEVTRKNSLFSLSDSKPNQRCLIKLLGFVKEKLNRVLLLPKSIESGKEIIRQIALGKSHVLILTESGLLYGAGTNECGQIGIDNNILRQNSFIRRNQCLKIINPMLITIDLNQDECILSIAVGDYHSGALIVSTSQKCQKSYVFTWGWGVHGQLGHGDIDNQYIPKRLEWDFNKNSLSGEEFPIELSMGCHHSVILTNKGYVYCFGNNSHGQLGSTGLQKSLTPLLVERLSQNITHIDTKYFHTVCCTVSNDLYVWGIHPNIWQNSINHEKTHEIISTPEKVDTGILLNNENIIQISCGTSHTTILTESKLVYCFGSNVWGQLGLGNRKDISKLVEVKMPMPINYISSDDGITIGMNISEKSTKLFVWGRCSHSLIQEHIKNLISDTVKPQLLVEYLHDVDVK